MRPPPCRPYCAYTRSLTDFGLLSLVAALEHGALHCARFIYAKQANLIYETATGRSGVIGCLLLLPIVLPMKTEYLRTKVWRAADRGFEIVYALTLVLLCTRYLFFRIPHAPHASFHLQLHVRKGHGRFGNHHYGRCSPTATRNMLTNLPGPD